ncbi:MAG: helix-turn-helix domain-containing protein [Lachnospiraceae bacterium]|nr:helix-turn-helix domain-containing protein [Lachnospiraceae bacterium]
MNESILENLRIITKEEQEILDGNTDIQKNIYTSQTDFVIDSDKMLKAGQLIQFRPHTRFIHFPKHRHNYVELVYMCSGSSTHIINDDTTVTLEAGDLLFMNQNVYHEILPSALTDISVNFIILPEFFNHMISMIEVDNILSNFLISTIAGDNCASNYLLFQTKDILPITNLIENLIWSIIHELPNSNHTIQTTMGLLFMNLSHYTNALKKDDPNQFDQNIIFFILQYIDLNYKNGTLEEASEAVNMPTYSVSRLLKKYTSHNFKELLQTRKLQEAANLLTQTRLPVEDILNDIGYNNSSYFYRVFKDYYKCSPKEYREFHNIQS